MRTVGFVHRAGRRALQRGLARAVASAILITAGAASLAAAAPAHRAPAAKTAAAGTEASPVDINTADTEKLATLPGIGPSIAQRIVDYRKEHGAFKSVDELVNVRGVGEKLLAKLRDHVTVGGKD